MNDPAAPGTPVQQYGRGEMIFAEGGMGDLAYVVREGEVEILKGGTGKPTVLRTMGPGEMFGEMALITTNPRAASAVAKTDVVLEVIDRVGFTRLLQADSEFAMLTMKRLAGMVPEAQSRLLSSFKAEQEAEKVGRRGLFGLRRPKKQNEISAFEPDFVQIEQETVPAGIRFSGYAIASFLLLALAWTGFAFTDTTVTGAGKVITTLPNITVAPFDSGIVRQVNVKQGDQVKRGQVLATLDSTVSDADLHSSRSQLTSTEAQMRRLETELGRRPAGGVFSADRFEDALQKQLYGARTQQLQATIAQHAEDIRNFESQIAGKREEAKDLEGQLTVLRELTRVREDFFRKERDAYQREGQYKIQYLEAQRAQAQVERDLNTARNSAASLEAQIRSKRAVRDAFVADWQAKANQELVSVMRDHSKMAEQFKKFDRAASVVEITSPSDAIVLNVKTRTPGTVLRAADVFFELVPADVPMEFEVDIMPRDVAQLQLGDKVSVKLDSLPFMKHGVIEGRLRLVSEDSYDKTLTGQQGPVFRARVGFEKLGLTSTPPNFRLVPGMTVTADIKVGTRSLISYFTYPLIRSGQTSFREP
jgi:HlyD family secretion protein